MEALAERTTLLLPRFPVALRLAMKANAVAEGRYLTDVFAELVETALDHERRNRERRQTVSERADDMVRKVSQLQEEQFMLALTQGYHGGKPLTLSEVRDAVPRLVMEGRPFEEIAEVVRLSVEDVRHLAGDSLSVEEALSIAQFPDGRLWDPPRQQKKRSS